MKDGVAMKDAAIGPPVPIVISAKVMVDVTNAAILTALI
jgi:hypothetical protein